MAKSKKSHEALIQLFAVESQRYLDLFKKQAKKHKNLSMIQPDGKNFFKVSIEHKPIKNRPSKVKHGTLT